MQKLTERQEDVWNFIREHIASKGYPPTLREIAAHVGIRSTNGVNDHLRALERKGRIRRTDKTSRGLVVLDPGQLAEPAPPTPSSPNELERKLREALAGYNIIATKDGRLVQDFPRDLARNLVRALGSPASHCVVGVNPEKVIEHVSAPTSCAL